MGSLGEEGGGGESWSSPGGERGANPPQALAGWAWPVGLTAQRRCNPPASVQSTPATCTWWAISEKSRPRFTPWMVTRVPTSGGPDTVRICGREAGRSNWSITAGGPGHPFPSRRRALEHLESGGELFHLFSTCLGSHVIILTMKLCLFHWLFGTSIRWRVIHSSTWRKELGASTGLKAVLEFTGA